MSPLACGGGQLQAYCRAKGSSGVSGDGGEDAAAEVEGGAVAAYVWTLYEMDCFLRPSCDRAATFRAAVDRITVKVPQNSVLRRRRGSLGFTL